MKKLVFIGLAAAMALMSCSRDEVIVQNPDNAITFEGAFADNMTKANDITIDNISNLALYGSMKTAEGEMFTIFDKKEATVADGKATYTPTQFWFEGNTYDFLAIAPFNHKLTSSGILASTGLPERMSMQGGNFYDTDLMIADPAPVVGKKQGNSPVGLNFKHILSRVKFSFFNEMGTEAYAIRIKDVKVGSLINEPFFEVSTIEDNGNVTWVSEDANTPAGAAEFAIAADNAIENQKNLSSDHCYMIPFSDNYDEEGILKPARNTAMLGFTVELMMKKDSQWKSFETYIHSIKMPEVFYQLKQGFSYNFKIALNEGNIDPDGQLEPIEFTVETVEGWDANPEQDVVVPVK